VDAAEILDKLLRPGGSTAGAADVIGLVGSTLGLGFLSGFRLYATLVALGLAIRFQWFVPNETMATLNVLADWRVLGAAATMGLIEFLADKIPWVDSAWDSVHTFIRPLAAMAMAATVLGNIDPVGKTLLALLCGGVALTTHSAKAATRFAVNHSPEPFSNWVLSAAEDLAAPLALWFISAHPGVFLGFLALFLALFAYAAPAVMRQMRLELVALRTLISRWAGTGPTVDASLPSSAVANPRARELWNLLHGYLDELPPNFANKSGCNAGLRAAATKSLIGMNRSIGYLFFRDHKLTFMTRRWFKTMAHSLAYADMKTATLQNGLFLDQLILEDVHGQRLRFDLFRVAPNSATASIKLATSAAGPAGSASPSV
jgi:hypothetical protein